MRREKVEICIELCRSTAVLPAYARRGDAGMDVCAAEEMHLEAGQTAAVPTGLKLAIPEGYEIQVRPRSGISLKTPLRLANSPGTIDSGFRDELRIIITNTSNPSTVDSKQEYSISDSGNKNGTYIIRQGERIAQIVLQRLPEMHFKIVESVEGIGHDRGGGFGSSGVK